MHASGAIPWIMGNLLMARSPRKVLVCLLRIHLNSNIMLHIFLINLKHNVFGNVNMESFQIHENSSCVLFILG